MYLGFDGMFALVNNTFMRSKMDSFRVLVETSSILIYKLITSVLSLIRLQLENYKFWNQ